MAIKKPKGAESKNIPDETPKNITNYATAEEGRIRSKEETRQEISNAIAQSSRLLVALKTEDDDGKKNPLKKWLQPRNGTNSNCDVVILVKKCELEPKEECVAKQKESCQKNICGKTFENQCKTVPRNVCKYVPVIKNCFP